MLSSYPTKIKCHCKQCCGLPSENTISPVVTWHRFSRAATSPIRHPNLISRVAFPTRYFSYQIIVSRSALSLIDVNNYPYILFQSSHNHNAPPNVPSSAPANALFLPARPSQCYSNSLPYICAQHSMADSWYDCCAADDTGVTEEQNGVWTG